MTFLFATGLLRLLSRLSNIVQLSRCAGDSSPFRISFQNPENDTDEWTTVISWTFGLSPYALPSSFRSVSFTSFDAIDLGLKVVISDSLAP